MIDATVVAVVVTYSATADDLATALSALVDGGGVDHVIVVDTGGGGAVAPDDFVDLVRMENRGYGAAANRGFELARRRGATVIALLNDDVIVSPGWVEPLLSCLEGRVGAVQPKLLVAGSEPPVINSLGVVVGPDGAGTDVADGELDDGSTPGRPIDVFTGGAVMVRPDFLDATGGFDERYFLYYEDVDLALRGAELGWTYRVEPSSVVEHARGMTTGQDPDRTRFLQERNRLWTAFRFGSPATVGRAVWLSVRRVRHRPRRVHLHALAAGLAGAPRRLVERWRVGADEPR